MAPWRVALVAAATLVACVSLASSGSIFAAKERQIPMIIHVNEVGSGPVDIGIRYDPIDVASHITQQQAVAAAMAWLGQPQASQAARIETRSVLFTNEQWVQRDAAGNSHPVLQRVPAWVVTFSGIDFPLVGGGDVSSTPRFNHEANVVIDARTGEYLQQFSYRKGGYTECGQAGKAHHAGATGKGVHGCSSDDS